VSNRTSVRGARLVPDRLAALGVVLLALFGATCSESGVPDDCPTCDAAVGGKADDLDDPGDGPTCTRGPDLGPVDTCGCAPDPDALACMELLVGVNRDVGLSDDFVPETISVPGGYGTRDGLELRPLALGYFMEMADAARSATGRRLRVGSSYRSFCTQCALFADYASSYGEEQANTFSAHAGHSEHQLGTTADLFDEDDDFLGGPYDIAGSAAADPEIYAWLDANAWTYGFMNSYPPNDADHGDRFASRTYQYTKYIPEPWHWRYVGRAAAARHHDLHEATGIRVSCAELMDLLEGTHDPAFDDHDALAAALSSSP
jgi:LAS superfamily LD-carboxypeptidase LdcB